MKAVAVQEAILTVGMIIISATLLATQIPSMANDIQSSLSKESVKGKANDIANLLSIAIASPSELRLTYSFPAVKSYSLVVKDGYVTVSSGADSSLPVKTLVHLEFSKNDVQTLTIIKTPGGVRIE